MSKKPCLFDIFSSVPDPRRKRGNYIYPLDEILFLTISGVLSGVEDWVHIETFGIDQLEWLRRFKPFASGIPSHDCLGDVFSHLDHKAFSAAFIEWAAGLSEQSEGKIVSIDGKRVCNSYDSYSGKSAIHLVSAFASLNGLVIGQVKTSEKSNEITAIPELLELISIEGCLVTIDAMGCQKEIAEKIIDQGGDYILALKANQESLFEQVKQGFNISAPEQEDKQLDSGHGRVEIRHCQILTDFRFIEQAQEWKGIKAVAKVQAQRHDKLSKKVENQDRYYITSISKADKINQAVRLHWGIENKLHWVLDVNFAEDKSRKRMGNMPENFALITKTVINLVKKHPDKASVKLKRMKAAWNQQFREQVLGI